MAAQYAGVFSIRSTYFCKFSMAKERLRFKSIKPLPTCSSRRNCL